VELEKLIEFGERLIKAGFLGGNGCILKFLFSSGQQSTDGMATALKASNAWAMEGMRTFPDMSYAATQGLVWAWIEEMAGCELEIINGYTYFTAVRAWRKDIFEHIRVTTNNRIEAIVLIAEEMKRRKDEEEEKKRVPIFKRFDRIENIDGNKASFLWSDSEEFCVFRDGDYLPCKYLNQFLSNWKLIPEEQPKQHLPTKLAPGVWVKTDNGLTGFIVGKVFGDKHGTDWVVQYNNDSDTGERAYWPEHALTIIPTPELP